MKPIFCPFADSDSEYRCQRFNCAVAVAHRTDNGEVVWTCGLIRPGAGAPIIIARGAGNHSTFVQGGNSQCQA